MQNSERHSPSSWKEALKPGVKLGIRSATSFALACLALNAIHFRGNPRPIDPTNLPTTGIPSEDGIISQLPQLLEEYPDLLAYHEPMRVVTKEPIPDGHNGTNAVVPDFVFSLRPLRTTSDIVGALVVEATIGRLDKPPKRRQYQVLATQGIRSLIIGPKQLAEIQTARTGKQIASALFGAFWPTNGESR